MTLLAIRPAKSFWKKVQFCRITCQWLCQRTRLTIEGTMAWLRTSWSRTNVTGRMTSRTATIQRKVCQWALNISPLVVVASMPTTRPTKIGIMASATEPTATSPMRRPIAVRNCLTK